MDFLSIIHSFQIETIISQELDLDPPSPNLPAEDYFSKFRTMLKILLSELIFESLKCTQSNLKECYQSTFIAIVPSALGVGGISSNPSSGCIIPSTQSIEYI